MLSIALSSMLASARMADLEEAGRRMVVNLVMQVPSQPLRTRPIPICLPVHKMVSSPPTLCRRRSSLKTGTPAGFSGKKSPRCKALPWQCRTPCQHCFRSRNCATRTRQKTRFLLIEKAICRRPPRSSSPCLRDCECKHRESGKRPRGHVGLFPTLGERGDFVDAQDDLG